MNALQNASSEVHARLLPLSEAETPLVAALDVGTSSVRSLVFDAQGRQIEGVGSQIKHSPRTTPDGGSEFDADELLNRCIEVLASLNDANIPKPGAIAVSTFWHSLVGVDDQSRAVTPVYLWADTRSHAQVIALRDKLDERAVHARTGCLFHTSYLPARILWLKETEPDLCRQVTRWMSFAEYVFLRLFGTPACSHSMASGTGMFNLNALQWDEEVLQALGVSPDELGTLVKSSQSFSGPGQSYAARLGRLADVPWYPALGDGACSNVGSGCVTPERPAVMIGTSGAMRTVWAVDSLTPPWGLWGYRVDHRRFVVGGALSNGGNLAQWLKETMQLEDLSSYDPQLLAARPAEHGLTVLPFWAGERSPGWAADATGAIVGLRLHTRPLDLLQACMEAVAYRFSLIFERLLQTVPRIDSLVATGGGLLRSRSWLQIICDTLNRPIQVSGELEASSRGAALVALEAMGVWDDLKDIPSALGATYTPRPGYHEMHMEAREKQLSLYQQLIG